MNTSKFAHRQLLPYLVYTRRVDKFSIFKKASDKESDDYKEPRLLSGFNLKGKIITASA